MSGYGPQNLFADQTHADKYRGPGESFEEAMTRVARALGDDQKHFQELLDMLLEQRFLPAGRVQSAVGSPRVVTPYNCFVSDTIPDSMEGIMDQATKAAMTMRMGGGIGYDFSTLRPRGDRISTLDSSSSGPISFMEIYDAVCSTVCSAGHRRGAQMGVLRIDHPDIEEFIRAKQNNDKLTNFNISVAVTDEFMAAVRFGTRYPLTFNGEEYRRIEAGALWEELMRSTREWAEPGVLFIDRINDMNNLYYVEQIAATNPCAEQPLPPNGACLLGSFNLVKYLIKVNKRWRFNWDAFYRDIPVAVRAMDNVINTALYPLDEQRQEAYDKRRMGLGVTGMANAIEAMGAPYGSPEFLEYQAEILSALANATYLSSAEIAANKGPFPLFWREGYMKSKFIGTLDSEVQREIEQYGIRNSHLTSIAPTGTISLCADNVSSGIEPVFAYKQKRTVRDFNGKREVSLNDYGYENLGVEGRTVEEVTPDEHLAVLSTAYKYVDSAVSKTCNLPASLSWDGFKDIYMRAWENGCKGCTTYTVGGSRGAILEKAPEEKDLTYNGSACYYDAATGQKTCE